MNQLPPATQTEHWSGDAHELSDQDLVAEVLRKDRKATAEFVARCADWVYGYIRCRLAPRTDLVDDLMQETLLAAWVNLDKYRGDSTLRSWLLGIARHKVEDHYRKRLREIQFEEEGEKPGEEPVSEHDLEDTLSRQQAGHIAREILASLPESYSVILQSRYWEQRSLRDIAVGTDKTEKAIERHLARARNQFREKWNERQSASRRWSVRASRRAARRL
jgi:RNA polymerase sigma-70 factor, ECF subfamily